MKWQIYEPTVFSTYMVDDQTPEISREVENPFTLTILLLSGMYTV